MSDYASNNRRSLKMLSRDWKGKMLRGMLYGIVAAIVILVWILRLHAK